MLLLRLTVADTDLLSLHAVVCYDMHHLLWTRVFAARQYAPSPTRQQLSDSACHRPPPPPAK